MMTNLFSIFDPSTKMMSLNWLSLLIVMLVVPAPYKLVNSRKYKISQKVSNSMKTEFKTMSSKTPYALVFIITMFVFVAVNNFMGLTSYTFTATSHMSVTMSLALPVWLGFVILSFTKNLMDTMIHMIPVGTPSLLMPFMVLIETVSNLIRPITLSVRLAANMIAGHLILVLVSSVTASANFIFLPLVMMAQLALSLLEIAVSLIQAYVISVLITLYMSETN